MRPPRPQPWKAFGHIRKYGGRTRKGLADALSGSVLKLVEDEGL